MLKSHKTSLIVVFLLFLSAYQVFSQDEKLVYLTSLNNLLYSVRTGQNLNTNEYSEVLGKVEQLIGNANTYTCISDFHTSLYYSIVSHYYFLKQNFEADEGIRLIYLDSSIFMNETTLNFYQNLPNEGDKLYLDRICHFGDLEYFKEEIEQTIRFFSGEESTRLNRSESNDHKFVWRELNEINQPGLNRSYFTPTFQWPPPKASASKLLPVELFKDLNTIGDLERKMIAALDDCGYSEISFYAIPEGFALVTRLEQINEDGSPKSLPDRWKTTRTGLTELTLQSYFKALFFGNPGYFRVIAFMVTPVPFKQASKEVSKDDALDWLTAGLNSLPKDVRSKPLTPEYKCTALIYEFMQPESTTAATLMNPSLHSGKDHLEKSKLWQTLNY